MMVLQLWHSQKNWQALVGIVSAEVEAHFGQVMVDCKIASVMIIQRFL